MVEHAADRRYSVRSDKIRGLGFALQVPVDDGLAEVVRWYRDNQE
jgi:dTDP-glucose 4,6-dehydratase